MDQLYIGSRHWRRTLSSGNSAHLRCPLRHDVATQLGGDGVPATDTTVIALIVGIMGAAYGPLLKDAESDKILMVICSQVQQQSLFGRWLVTVLFAAVLAAIMSTADSVLLSISSMLTKDIYGQWFQTAASEARLTAVGKVASWVLLAALTCLAILLRHNTSLVYLLDRKFDLLLQLAPAFFIGVHWSGLRAGPTLLGLIVGVAIAMVLATNTQSLTQLLT